MGLGTWVSVLRVVRRSFGRHAKVFTGPGAEVHLFASLAAERAKGIGGAINAVPTAGGANNGAGARIRAFWEVMSHPGFPRQMAEE